ncbi:MAG: pyridoxamine 5'-phosphate oxidase family protein [Candidatus Helarchaeota archaeon]
MRKKMPVEALKKEILAFFNKRKILVLCTCNNNIPRATPIDYYRKKDSFTLYLGLSPGRKIKNIEENPIVSVGIYTPMAEGKIQGMQITASGKDHLILLREENKEFAEAQKIVRGKRKLILKLIPEIIELLDYDFAKKGYAVLQRLKL